MIRLCRIQNIIVISLFVISILSACRPKAGTNAYLHMKVKPSQQEQRTNKKVIRRQEKMYRKQMLSNRKHLFGSKRDPEAPKK
ncbi:MAG: hypothetical protein ACXVDT_08140 [Bacteroidia bacterium]